MQRGPVAIPVLVRKLATVTSALPLSGRQTGTLKPHHPGQLWDCAGSSWATLIRLFDCRQPMRFWGYPGSCTKQARPGLFFCSSSLFFICKAARAQCSRFEKHWGKAPINSHATQANLRSQVGCIWNCRKRFSVQNTWWDAIRRK